jgi:hypothetical protein
MSCKKIQAELSDRWGKGKFSYPDSLKEHLQSCRECSEFLRDLAQMREILEVPEQSIAPGELDYITFENIIGSQEPARVTSPRRSRFWRLAWLFAPAALVAIVATVISFSHFGDGTFPVNMVNKGNSINIQNSTNQTEANNSKAVAALSTIPSTEQDLIDQIASNDSLPDLVISSMASDDKDLDYAVEEIIGRGEVDQILNSMSDEELQALYNKIDQLKG